MNCDVSPACSSVSKMSEKRPSSAASCEPGREERTVVMSSCVAHGNVATSYRGARVESWPRHQASIWSASPCITGATEPRLSTPSEGMTYTQWIGLPATTLGARSAVAEDPHQLAAAETGAALAPTGSNVDERRSACALA